MTAPVLDDPTISDETILLKGLRSRDAASYERMVRALGPPLLATARRMLRNEADARDCLQDAFLHAFKHIHGFDGRAALATWLHRIVVNTALMRLRARRRQREDPLDELMPAFDADGCRIDRRTPHSGTEALIRRQEVRRFVRAAIDRLPESSRTVLLLRDIEGYSIEETARLLETTPGAVKMRLHRARAALKKLIEPIVAGEAP